MIIVADRREFCDKLVIRFLFWLLYQHFALKVLDLFPHKFNLLNLQGGACLVEHWRVRVELDSVDASYISDWFEEVIEAKVRLVE